MPRQLPAPPVHFANREPELSLLTTRLRGHGRGPSIVVLKGPGGVGKSALALEWLNRSVDHFPDGQLYAGLTQSTGAPVAVDDVLGEFLRALGVTPEHVPPGLSERTSLFRSVTAGRSLAVLLENAVSAAQVRTLLPASPTSVVAVTSRWPLAGLLTDGALVVPVDPLDDTSAIELLGRHIGPDRVATEREPSEALVDLCAGLPIAVCVVAAQVLLRPHRPVATLVAELRDERRRLDLLSIGDDLSVRSTFDLSVRSLPADAASAYRTIGVLPGRLTCPELIAATNRFGNYRARRALDTLVDASLMTEVEDELYRCHDLVRAHARAEAHAGLGIEARDAVQRATLEWHLHVAREAGRTVMPSRPLAPFEFPALPRYEQPRGVAGYDGALAWLDRHRSDLAAAVTLAGEAGLPEIAYALADAMQPLFIVHRHYREAIDVDEQALAAALALGDPTAESHLRNRLARMFIQLGRLAHARRHIDALLESSARSGDRRARASGLKSLARLHTSLGHHDDAVGTFTEVLEILRETDRGRAEALTLTELGSALIDAGRPNDAVGHLEEARTILLTTQPPDPYNAARATIPLARAQLRRGDHDTARRLLEDVRERLADLGSDYQLGRTHQTLAELHEATGERDLAREHRSLADELFARIAGSAPDTP